MVYGLFLRVTQADLTENDNEIKEKKDFNPADPILVFVLTVPRGDYNDEKKSKKLYIGAGQNDDNYDKHCYDVNDKKDDDDDWLCGKYLWKI